MSNSTIMSEDVKQNLTLKESFMTTKQLAEILGTSPKVIIENARKCLPNKIIENGKTTYWTQAEATVLIDYSKINSHRNDTTFTNLVKVTETELTPALKIKKAMELMQEGYEEELQILRGKVTELTPKADFYDAVTGSKDCIEIGAVAKILNFSKIGRNKLFEILRIENILQSNNIPYQRFVDLGYFRVVESKYSLPNGDTKINLKTIVSQKGITAIRKLLIKKGYVDISKEPEYMNHAINAIAGKIADNVCHVPSVKE